MMACMFVGVWVFAEVRVLDTICGMCCALCFYESSLEDVHCCCMLCSNLVIVCKRDCCVCRRALVIATSRCSSIASWAKLCELLAQLGSVKLFTVMWILST